MSIDKELRKPEVAAVAGAVGGLLAATVVPAAVILTLGALTAGGVYLYSWKFGKRKAVKGGTDGDVIDITPEDGGKEK